MPGLWRRRADLTREHSKSSVQFSLVFARLGKRKKIWRGGINEKGCDVGIGHIIYCSLY